MPVHVVQVDAFTDRPFTGNPAAVCILEAPPEEWWLQDVAREMNLSETAFLLPHEEGYDLRWFTPVAEVDLCGHATLASAHVLWEDGHLAADEVARFHTRSGLLVAWRSGEWIELDFPSRPAFPVETPERLEGALGTTPLRCAMSASDLLVEIDTERVLRTLRPNIQQLAEFDVRGIIVTSRPTTHGVDFVSRFFAPRLGVPEDPVTGSAHCTLGPYWAERLQKNDLVGYQVSSRGGTVLVRPRGDRVILGGRAVTVMRAELLG